MDVLLLIFPVATLAAGRNWHRSRDRRRSVPAQEARGGCRDFTGPFPQSLSMSMLQPYAARLRMCTHASTCWMLDGG